MPKLSRDGTSFGKFFSLGLEINYMNGLAIEDRSACDASSRARKRKPDLLRDRTTVGNYMQNLPVQLENGHIVRFAKARRAPDNNLQYRLQCSRRSANDLKNLCRRALLFKRLVALAGQLRDL